MTLFWRVGFNFIYKILIFPSVLLVLSKCFPDSIRFSSRRFVWSLTGLFIAIGLIADETVLPRCGNLKATLQGSVFMSVTTWFSQFLNCKNRIKWNGAVLIGIILGLCELPMHSWILKIVNNRMDL